MKRGILLIFILLLASSVSAQEITLFNQTYPIILVLPLILIIIALTFFLFIYIKDHSEQMNKFFSSTFSIKRHKKEKEEEKKEINYFTEIENFELRYPNLSIKDAFSQFSGLFKDYLKDELKLTQEHTPDELKILLIKKKKDLVPIFEKITLIKYSPSGLENADIKELVSGFKLAISKKAKPKIFEEKSFLDKLKLPSFKPGSLFKTGEKEKIYELPKIGKEKQIKKSLISKLNEEYISSKKRFFLNIFKKKHLDIKKHKEIKTEFEFDLFTKLKQKIKLVSKHKTEKIQKLEKHQVKSKPKFKLNISKLNIFSKLSKDIKYEEQLVKEKISRYPAKFGNLVKDIKEEEQSVKEKAFEYSEKLEKSIVSPFELFFGKIKLNKEIKEIDKTINLGISLVKKDLDKAEQLYSKSLTIYYRLPMDIEQRFSQRLIDLHDKIDYETRKKEVKEIIFLTSKIEDIKKVVPKDHHNFLESMKIFLDLTKEKIDVAEDRFIRSLNHSYKDLSKKLKIKKTEFYLPILKTPNFIDYLKELISEIRYKEEIGIYKLHRLEVNFVDHLHDFLHHLDKRKSKKIFEIKDHEQEFLKKSEVLLNYIKDKDKSIPEKLQDHIINEIKNLKKPSIIPIPRKPSVLLKATKEIKQDLEKIHKNPEIIAEQKPVIKKRIKKLHESIKTPALEYPEAKLEEIHAKPFKFEPLLAKSRRFNALNQQELDIVKRLKKLEVQDTIVKTPSKFITKKHYMHKNPWESKIEKVRHETPRTLTKLNEEEQKLNKKLHEL
nr:hypothetical protein [Candidatus Woesearchaeota archaeon]